MQSPASAEPVWLRLRYAGETKIRRHVKVRQDANPFAPQWRPYFEERAFQKNFGITREKAGIKPSSCRLPLPRVPRRHIRCVLVWGSVDVEGK